MSDFIWLVIAVLSRGVFNATKVGVGCSGKTFAIGVLILGIGGMLLKIDIMIEAFWILLTILLLTIFLGVIHTLLRRQR